MARSLLFKAALICCVFHALAFGQTPFETINTREISGTTTTFRPVFTVPASADQGAHLLPNVNDPDAVNAQAVCPGYTASQLQMTDSALSAVLELAGTPCNVYGTDVEILNLKVEYQAANRLAINISPANVVSFRPSRPIIKTYVETSQPGFIQFLMVHSA